MKNKQNVPLAIALCVGMPVLFVGYWIISNLQADHETAQLAQEGADGVVRVLSYEDTGVAVNRRPRIRFQLELQPDKGGTPLHVQMTMAVSTMDAPRLQVGVKRKVRYLPSDPETMHFVD